MVLDNVIDVYVMIILGTLKKQPYPYKRRATITRPLALLMSKQDHLVEVALTMMEDAMRAFYKIDVILSPVTLKNHFYIFILDKQKEYVH